MDSEFDNKPQSESTANEGAREGYTPAGGYQKNYRSNGRPQRPRINSQRAYSSDRSNEGGFRPEGFGMALQQNNGEHRQGGYQQRGGYQPRQQGGYGRPQGGGYNNNHGGYGRPQGGGYNNRGGYGRPQGGGYNNRGGYGRPHTPGYDPNAKYNLKKRIEYKEHRS